MPASGSTRRKTDTTAEIDQMELAQQKNLLPESRASWRAVSFLRKGSALIKAAEGCKMKDVCGEQHGRPFLYTWGVDTGAVGFALGPVS